MQEELREYSVSVVIPAYNAADHVGRAIESVLSQTHRADEIIVVDDGSTDATWGVLEGYGERIIALRQENAGAAVARNTAVARATCRWIAFLDADDVWVPEKLSQQIAHLKAHPELVWSHSNYWFTSDEGGAGEPAFKASPAGEGSDVIADYLDVHDYYTIRTSTAIVARQVLYEVGLFVPGQNWQDTDVFLKIAYRHPAIGYLHSALTEYYSDTPNSLTARTSRKDLRAALRCELIERHLRLSQERGRQEKFVRCISVKVAYWVRVALGYRQYRDARELLSRLGHLLPTRQRWQLCVQAYVPYVGDVMVAAYFGLKRLVHKCKG